MRPWKTPGDTSTSSVLALEHRLRLGERLAAAPDLDDARIARRGQRSGSEIRAEQNRVGVDIGRFGLGLAEIEPVVEKRFATGSNSR